MFISLEVLQFNSVWLLFNVAEKLTSFTGRGALFQEVETLIPSILKVGQTLVVGSSAKAAATAQTVDSNVKAAPTPAVVAKAPPIKPAVAQEKVEAKPLEKPETTEEKTYVVAKGDNPYSLAKKFNITQVALMKANNIDDPKKLKIGQKLVIP